MRNLKLLRSSRGPALRGPALRGPGCPQAVTVRGTTGTLLVASQASIVEFDPGTGQVVAEASLTAGSFLPEGGGGGGCVVGLQDLSELDAVCVATAGGDVIVVNLNTSQLECVGSVSSGLTSMSWSPDEELVVLTTGQETIVMMTKDFEPITEVPIHQDDFGEGKFVTVGWGRKETQFHGSEGKQAAQRKQPEVAPAASWDDGQPRVTWRGDGQLFAVGVVCPEGGARKVRVWNREGVLQATSEPVSGLEEALCWRPSGALIAAAQRRPHKHCVVFLEKNGLLHGDFSLPPSKDRLQVRALMWNSDSSVLGVWLEGVATEDNLGPAYIQLWQVGNYHWYLKQSLEFGGPLGAPACVCWDPQRPLRLHLVTRGWTPLTYDWTLTTDRSGGADAGVAVIDGDKVLVTAFRQGVVPPPMSSFQLQLPSPVSQVSFLQRPPRTNQLAALTADGGVSVFVPDAGQRADGGVDGFRTVAPPLVLKMTFRVGLPPAAPLSLHHLLWLEEELFVGVVPRPTPTGSTLLLLRPDPDAANTLAVRWQMEVGRAVMSVAPCPQTGAVAFQLEDGRIQKLLWGGAEPAVQEWTDASGRSVSFPTACVQTAVCSVGGQECVLGLTERSHLYAGDTQLASGVSSFAVCGGFLLVTSHAHTCRCLQLDGLSVKGLQAALSSEGGRNDETFRKMERGGRIVTVVPEDTRVVLQMPRGNLETVHHRSLVLAQIRSWLDGLRFREAFLCSRKLRVDLNFLYDHNPQVFLDHLETFVTQLDSPPHINLFLTELREEDTTCSMYPRPSGRPAPPPPAPGRKVEVVCDAVRSTVERLGANRYFLSVLTALVKKAELGVALQKVHDLRVNPPARPAVSAEEALRHLVLLVEGGQLWDHALGTYDLPLVLMVAERSQKDPKEYLPFLRRLQGLDPPYQRYTIDRHLRRYGAALQHLSRCGAEHFPEALALVKEQHLYPTALRLYPDGPEHLALSREYAQHLLERREAEQAGLLLWRCGDAAAALQAFASCCSWRSAVCAAEQVPLPPEQVALLARQLAGKLTEQRRFSEAALLLDQYAKDCEEAISALITGALWEEALRLIYLHNRHDITETNLKPALLEAVDTQTTFLEAQWASFSRHRSRLGVVREQKKRAGLDLLDEGGADGPEAELYSEASSVTGSTHTHSHAHSHTSSRSSKNRRKAERKKLSLKEGGPMEEQALMHALGEVVATADGMREEVGALLRALVRFQLDRRAEPLQRAYDQVLSDMEAALPEVWPESPVGGAALLTGPDSTSNSITASYQQQRAMTSQPAADAPVPPKIRTGVQWKLSILS
ncbi:elongator complex protein 1 [Antennarius striatus]|uniref:elongator complex protein 1 n=1 Tax=Antennarius striatus TaxID=241820 RepID=UPI0035AF52F5